MFTLVGWRSLEPQTPSSSPSLLIDPNRPIAYLHLDHVGFGLLEGDGKRHLRIWMELHNNTIFPIRLRVYGAPAGDSADAVGVMDVIVPRTSFRQLTTEEERELGPKRKPPIGIWYDTGTRDSIAPGEFIRFSLPAGHLGKRWDIHIPFDFDLPSGHGPREENAWGGSVATYLAYSFADLPQAAKKALDTLAGQTR